MNHFQMIVPELGTHLTLASAPPLAGRAAAAAPPTQATTTTESSPLPAASSGPMQPPSRPDFTFLFIIVGVFVLMIFMSTWTARKEKKKRAELLSSIGRYDRVQTIGGIIGTVVDLRDDEIVIKVDDNTNTKITFARSAVQNVLKKGRGEGRSTELEPAEASA